MQTFIEKGLHTQSVITHLHKIVTIFKKLTLKLSNFKHKIAQNCSAAGGNASVPPISRFFVLHYTTLSEKYNFAAGYF